MNRIEEIKSYITEYLVLNGFPPTVREIGRGVNLRSSSNSHLYVNSLYLDGYLDTDLDTNSVRAYRLKNYVYKWEQIEDLSDKIALAKQHSKVYEIYDFVKSYIFKHSYSPSYREIADAIGISSVSCINKFIKVLYELELLKTINTKATARAFSLSGYKLELKRKD